MSTQYVPPARLLTMAEIEAANLAEANRAAAAAADRPSPAHEVTRDRPGGDHDRGVR